MNEHGKQLGGGPAPRAGDALVEELEHLLLLCIEKGKAHSQWTVGSVEWRRETAQTILAALSTSGEASPSDGVVEITVEDRREAVKHGHQTWHEVRENGRYLCTCAEREDADRIATALRTLAPPGL